jgi:hypothetical protein
MDCQTDYLALGDANGNTVMPWIKLDHGCVKLNQELIRFSLSLLELNPRLWRIN